MLRRGALKSLRSKTNLAPSVYAGPHFSLLPSNEKSFTLFMIGWKSQRCNRVLNLESALAKNSLMGWLLGFKCVIYMAKRSKRGTGLCRYRASWALLDVPMWKAEEELRNFERAREVQEVLKRQSRSTWEEQQGYKRCTAEVQEMNNGDTTEALHRTENT